MRVRGSAGFAFRRCSKLNSREEVMKSVSTGALPKIPDAPTVATSSPPTALFSIAAMISSLSIQLEARAISIAFRTSPPLRPKAANVRPANRPAEINSSS